MKKTRKGIIWALLPVLMAVLLQGCEMEKEVKCKEMSLKVPSGWALETMQKGSLIDVTVTAENDNNPHHILLLMAMNMEVNFTDLNADEMGMGGFDGVTFGPLEDDSLNGFSCQKAEVLSCELEGFEHIEGLTGDCYLLHENYKTYALMTLHVKGVKNFLPTILESFKIEKLANAKRRDARTELEELVSSLPFPMEMAEGIYFDNLRFASDGKFIEYEFRVPVITKDMLTEEDLADLTSNRQELIDAVHEICDNLPAVKRCIDEGYGITVRFLDANKEEMTHVRLSNEEILR